MWGWQVGLPVHSRVWGRQGGVQAASAAGSPAGPHSPCIPTPQHQKPPFRRLAGLTSASASACPPPGRSSQPATSRRAHGSPAWPASRALRKASRTSWASSSCPCQAGQGGEGLGVMRHSGQRTPGQGSREHQPLPCSAPGLHAGVFTPRPSLSPPTRLLTCGDGGAGCRDRRRPSPCRCCSRRGMTRSAASSPAGAAAAPSASPSPPSSAAGGTGGSAKQVAPLSDTNDSSAWRRPWGPAYGRWKAAALQARRQGGQAKAGPSQPLQGRWGTQQHLREGARTCT